MKCDVRKCTGDVVEVYHGEQYETHIPFAVGRCSQKPDAHRYFIIKGEKPHTNRIARPHWGWAKDSIMNRMDA